MKISVLNKEIENFYHAFYERAAYQEPNPDVKNYIRYTSYAMRMMSWAAFRSFYKLAWEPASISFLRNYYNNLPNRHEDRDLSREELFHLADKFLLNKDFDEAATGIDFGLIREGLQNAFIDQSNFIVMLKLKKENRFTQENFNNLLNRNTENTAASMPSTVMVANTLEMPLQAKPEAATDSGERPTPAQEAPTVISAYRARMQKITDSPRSQNYRRY